MPFNPCDACDCLPASISEDLFNQMAINLLCGILDALQGGGGVASNVNLADVGGVAVSLGQKSMAASIPVVVASNQSAIPISGTITATPTGTQDVNLIQVAGSAVALGQVAMAASIPVAIASNQSTITVGQATGTNLHTVIDSGTTTVTQGTGTNLHTVIDSGTITTVTGVTTVSTVTTVTTVSTVTGVTAITGSVTPGTAAANLGKAEDAAAASGDTGVFVLGVRRDTPASTTTTDGDYHELAVTDLGAQYIEPANSAQTSVANSVAGASGGIATTGTTILTDSHKKLLISIYSTLDVACQISIDAGSTFPFTIPAVNSSAPGTLNICLGCNGRWSASNITAKALGSNSSSGTIYAGAVY